MTTLLQIICIVLFVYWLVLLARIILSWLGGPRSGPFRGVAELIYDLTEPPLRLVRGLLPTVRIGAMGLDLSPIIVFVALIILRSVLCTGRAGVGF